LENVSLGHGVSLLRWRSGGVEHPHDTPPYPFMPSPTFAHSSLNCATGGIGLGIEVQYEFLALEILERYDAATVPGEAKIRGWGSFNKGWTGGRVAIVPSFRRFQSVMWQAPQMGAWAGVDAN